VNAFIGYCLSILYYNFCLFLYYNYIIGYALRKRVDLLPFPMLQFLTCLFKLHGKLCVSYELLLA
jgi:hypothetical protein